MTITLSNLNGFSHFFQHSKENYRKLSTKPMLIKSCLDWIFYVWPKCDVNYWLFNMGKINISDKILIENLQKHKRWSSRKLLKEFSSKGWSRSGLNSLLKQTDAKGNADRAAGSGRPRSARTSANIAKVEELVCSQAGEPHGVAPTARTSIQWIMLCWELRSSEFILDENLNPSTNWNEPWRWNGDDYCRTLSTNLSLNGDNVYSYTEQLRSYLTFV